MGRVREVPVLEAPIPNASTEVTLPPLMDYSPESFHQRHVDIRLSQKQSIGMKKLFSALKNEAQLENNRFVQTPVDAVRWIMERVADAYQTR